MEQDNAQDGIVGVEEEEDPTRAIATQAPTPLPEDGAEDRSDLTFIRDCMDASVVQGDNTSTTPTAVPPLEEPQDSGTIATVSTATANVTANATDVMNPLLRGDETRHNEDGDQRKRHQNWDAWYEQMCEFQKKYGHCRPSEKENVKLSRWTYRQRYEYNQSLQQQAAGGPAVPESSSGMTADRMERLNQIGFEWSLTSVKGWDGMYQELVAYHAQYGHTNVPSHVGDGRTSLSRWVYKQRYQFNRFCEGKSPCQLNDARIQLLNDLNFQWKGHEHSSKTTNTNTATNLPVAESSYEELVQYKEEHGDSNVPD
eukprot:scaffold124704_cov46-Attheya_sp.AAC.1